MSKIKIKEDTNMCRRSFLFPEEAEAEVKAIRESEGIDEKNRKIIY